MIFLSVIHALTCFVTGGLALFLGIEYDMALGYEKDELKTPLRIVLIIFLASIIFGIVGLAKCSNAEWEYEKPYATEKIVALNDNNMLNGRFYLTSGYIDEDLYYQYIVQLNNGGFVSNKVKASNTTIFYDDDNYRVEWCKKTKQWLYFTAEETYNKVYIPEGSIANNYSIDLQ